MPLIFSGLALKSNVPVSLIPITIFGVIYQKQKYVGKVKDGPAEDAIHLKVIFDLIYMDKLMAQKVPPLGDLKRADNKNKRVESYAPYL